MVLDELSTKFASCIGVGMHLPKNYLESKAMVVLQKVSNFVDEFMRPFAMGMSDLLEY